MRNNYGVVYVQLNYWLGSGHWLDRSQLGNAFHGYYNAVSLLGIIMLSFIFSFLLFFTSFP